MSILQLPPADSSPSFRTRADRHTDRQTDRHTDRQTDRQTDTHDYCMPRGSAHRGIITCSLWYGSCSKNCKYHATISAIPVSTEPDSYY